MSGPFTYPVAEAVPSHSENVTGLPASIEDVQSWLDWLTMQPNPNSSSRFPLFFWERDSNPAWLYFIGQSRSNEMPFIVSKPGKVKELAISGKKSAQSNSMLTLYKKTAGSDIPLSITEGVLASVNNSAGNVTFEEGDFPYSGTTRVTINIVNNGPSLPLVITEDIPSKTVTIQLVTDSGGNSITTAKGDLREAFRDNTDITLLWRITATNYNNVQPEALVCSGGTSGDVMCSIFMRNKESFYKENLDISLAAGDMIGARCWQADRNDHYPIQLTTQILF